MTKTSQTTFVLVTAGDDDLGIVPVNEGRSVALDYAREMGCKVTLRDATTDRIVAVIRPRRTHVSN